MLVDPRGLGKPLMFSGREEHFYVWTKKIENYVSCVFPNVREALAFAAESQGRGHSSNSLQLACLKLELRRLRR